MLLFKKRFLEAIRRGEKTQTIRYWKHRRMRAGQRSYIPGCGYIQVVAVEPVTLDALTDRDAQLDGFSNMDELRHELQRCYPDGLGDGLQPYRVSFHVLPPEQQQEARLESQRRKATAERT